MILSFYIVILNFSNLNESIYLKSIYIFVPFIDKGKEEKVIVNKCALISCRTLVSQSRDRTRKQAAHNHANRLSVESGDLEANLKVILNGDEQVVDSRCCVYFSS